MEYPGNLMQDLRDKLQQIYASEGSLETTCCRQCTCCRVACPSMKYSEAVNLLNQMWETWTKEAKKDFLLTCVRYFFSRSLIKPCPILKDSDCQCYDSRPLNCRLYGMIPAETYNKRAQRMADRLDLPLDQVPLNTQCPFVRRKVGDPLTDEVIDRLDSAIDRLDVLLIQGGNARRATEAQAKVDKGWNYRSLHDWALYYIFGEEILVNLTQVLKRETTEGIQATLSELETAVKELKI